MKIGRQAFEELNCIAKEASAMYGREIECGGFLFSGSDGIIRRTRLPPIQPATESSCNLSRFFREMYIGAYKEGLYMKGMWHSHGSFDTFHSSDDNACLTNFLRNINYLNDSFSKWQAKLNEGSVDIFNSYKGYRIRLDKRISSLLFSSLRGVSEPPLGQSFYSLVINKETYKDDMFYAARNGKYDLAEARLDGNRLAKSKPRICFAAPKLDYDLGSMIACDKKPDSRADESCTASDKIRISGANGDLELLVDDAEKIRDSIQGIESLPDEQIEGYKRQKANEEEDAGKQARAAKISSLLNSANTGSVPLAEKLYNLYAGLHESYKPFYQRGGFIVDAIRKADDTLLEMFAVLAGKGEAQYCEGCSWKHRLKKLGRLYSKLKKENILGNGFYANAICHMKESLKEAPKEYAKAARKICNKISGKGIFRRILGRLLPKEEKKDGS